MSRCVNTFVILIFFAIYLYQPSFYKHFVAYYLRTTERSDNLTEAQGGCWDTTGSMGYFPHIHGNGLKLGIEEVESTARWVKGDGEWGPAGWPFDEDTPKI